MTDQFHPAPHPHRISKSRRLATGAAAAAGVVLIASWQFASAGTQADHDPAHSRALRAYYQQKPHWTGCSHGLQCASLKVPMDYAHPHNGHTFTLPLIRHRASDRKHRIGSLVYNPGGPGGSGVEDMKGGTIAEFGKQIRARFDVVSFDPRGVVGSKPAIKCTEGDAGSDGGSSGGADDAAYDGTSQLYPRTEAQHRDAVARADAEAKGCRTGSGALLRHVGTPDAARDVDVLRAALGDSKLNFLGWSYGTSLGTEYGELFPRRVRTMVLDGAVDPSLNWYQRAISQGTAFRKSVDDYAARCAEFAGDSCPGTNADEIYETVNSLYESVAKDPLPVGDTDETVDLETLNNVVTMAMYSPEQQWKGLSDALWQAYDQGDGTKLAKLATGDESDDSAAVPRAVRLAPKATDNGDAALVAINCLDVPHPKDPKQYWKGMTDAYNKAGVFGTSSVVTELSCRNWPKGTMKPHRAKAPGLPPVMVVGTTGDPATPYHEARSLARQLPHAMLLTYKGLGHTAYGRGGACVSRAVENYFLHGTRIRPGRTC